MKGFIIFVLFLVICIGLISVFFSENVVDQVEFEESFHDVIDVSTYAHDGGFLTMPTEGYIIRYLDSGEIITLKKTSDSITVKYTHNESFLVKKIKPYVTGDYVVYELYWNGD